MSDAKCDPMDKFMHNGHPTRQAMLDEMARQEEYRHQCEVKYLLSMSPMQIQAAIALRESKRGKDAVARLRDDIQKARPGCLNPCLNPTARRVLSADAMTLRLF